MRYRAIWCAGGHRGISGCWGVSYGDRHVQCARSSTVGLDIPLMGATRKCFVHYMLAIFGDLYTNGMRFALVWGGFEGSYEKGKDHVHRIDQSRSQPYLECG